MIRALCAIAALTLFVPAALATPVCKTGVLCGNSCISKDKVCHKTPGAAAAAKPAPVTAAPAASTPAPAAAPAKPTRCKTAKGKFTKCGTPGALPVT